MTRRAKLIPIKSREEIPTSFPSEDEERDWWAAHELTNEFLDEAERDPWTQLANLELELLKLGGRFDKLTDENRGLKERLEKLEAKLG